ncbi:hypothetical protein HPB49_024973 [Dermacentor silvarum]|uniref:Uncharacterized protein n=1 Tax=Dermacentor silvarum TaxID=543639 RepID=A0ACB8D124_DERSI|nr:hypothetical protein HPB49_024973 [Dermacentor silvarum]
MREKAMLKQEINKRHNGNFSAGYVPIFENSLHKTGLRGRKAFLFYGLVVGLFVVSLANLAVTVMLLGVLRIGYGMESLEFLPSGRLLRFLNNADLGTVVPHKGVIGGFKDTDLHIIGESQPATGRQMSDTAGPSLEVGPDWTVVSNVKEFRVRSPTTGRTIFSTEYQGFQLPKGIPNLSVKEAHVSRVSAAFFFCHSALAVLFAPHTQLASSRPGIKFLDGLGFQFSRPNYDRNMNQSLTLDGSNGIRILAAGLPRSENPSSDASYWYKLCVCMPSGRIFRVPVREQGFGCGDVRFPESVNPCT